MAQQSLYRRYRSQRFAELRGQDHVVRALRHAVASGTEGHGYLFSGPRGCGKTSTARILAKALNCTNLSDGEPCGVCDSCKAIEAGQSYDLFELDAASNNGVDAMRELIGRTAVGSPGRTKVYILDEVHMLSTAASNALLKTLEEPPEHVVFVLATTDPQKVLPTIRSRTQHFEFSLLAAEELTELVNWVIADAGLDVPPEAVAQVVRLGRGSARDTLSALDRVVASGGVVESNEPVLELAEAIADKDTGRAMAAVDIAIGLGIEPRSIGETLLATLRDAFLVAVGAETPHLTDDDRARAKALSSRLGTASITRALELIGSALVDLRQASSPRVPIEVAVIRLASPTADVSVEALLERIERLERAAASGGVVALAPAVIDPMVAATVSDADDEPEPISVPAGRGAAAAARAQLAERRPESTKSAPPSVPPRRATAPAPPLAPVAAPTPPPAVSPDPEPGTPASTAAPAPAPAPAAPTPVVGELSVDGVTAALSEVAAQLRPVAKAVYREVAVRSVDGDRIVLALPHASLVEKAEAARSDVEARLATALGRPLTVAFEGAAPAPASSPAAVPEQEPEHHIEEHVDVSQLTDADVSTSGADKLARAFPGSIIVDKENGTS